jgi:hypothetical protein
MRAGCAVLVAASLLSACRTGPIRPGTAPQPTPATQQPAPPSGTFVPGHEGRPFTVIPGESLLTILAFRGGALSKAGHNHVIAAHDLMGTVYVPSDPLRASFELRFAVAQLTVDEPQLRAKEGADFAADVPDSARDGTRHNMLGDALLDAGQFPEITLISERIEREEAHAAQDSRDAEADGHASQTNQGAGAEAHAQVHVNVTVRGQTHSFSVPVRYQLRLDRVTADGELPIRQSELGLKPFSAVMGALQVQDELHVRFHVVARLAAVQGSQGH